MSRSPQSLNQPSNAGFDIEKIRLDFPILQRRIDEKALVYLDNAATLQKPKSVMDSLVRFYSEMNSNVHRSVHRLSQEATEAYESTRQKVKAFLGLDEDWMVVFTRGTTHSINILANGLRSHIGQNDSVLITRMEHHANFVPWQQLCKRTNAHLRIAELDSEFRIELSDFQSHLAKKPKIVSFSAASNVLGTKNLVSPLSQMAKDAGAWVILDAAQSLAHLDKNLGASDFVVFSAHKLGGPTGVGVLCGRISALEKLEVCEFGGDMIVDVRDDASRWNELPWRLEAGTPNFADVVAMGEALRYLDNIDSQGLAFHEQNILERAMEGLSRISGLEIFGPRSLESRLPIFSFSLGSIHPHDLGTYLDAQGIAVRAGHHCAQPLHRKFNKAATTRASFAFYNRLEEVDLLVHAIEGAKNFFGRAR